MRSFNAANSTCNADKALSFWCLHPLEVLGFSIGAGTSSCSSDEVDGGDAEDVFICLRLYRR